MLVYYKLFFDTCPHILRLGGRRCAQDCTGGSQHGWRGGPCGAFIEQPPCLRCERYLAAQLTQHQVCVTCNFCHCIVLFVVTLTNHTYQFSPPQTFVYARRLARRRLPASESVLDLRLPQQHRVARAVCPPGPIRQCCH